MLTLYFSGTGNSKYIAELFTSEMGGECLSIEDQADFSGLILSADVIAFVYPIYVSRVPRIMREFVKAHCENLRGKKLVILCTQMEFSGDGVRCFTDLLARDTYTVVYAEHFMMPNNINNINIRMFRKTSEEKTKRLLAKARMMMTSVCADIRAGVVRKRGFNPISRVLGLMQGIFMPLMERVTNDAVRISGDCTGCGLCVRNCPMHNLKMANGKAAAGDNCTECYRCINLCPERAIGIYFKGKVRWQYHGVGNE